MTPTEALAAILVQSASWCRQWPGHHSLPMFQLMLSQETIPSFPKCLLFAQNNDAWIGLHLTNFNYLNNQLLVLFLQSRFNSHNFVSSPEVLVALKKKFKISPNSGLKVLLEYLMVSPYLGSLVCNSPNWLNYPNMKPTQYCLPRHQNLKYL